VTASLALEWSPIDAVGEDYGDCLKYWQEVSDDWWRAFAVSVWGKNLLRQAHLRSARARFEEAVASARKSQDHWIVGHTLLLLACAVQRIDIAASRPILEECIMHLRAAGDRWALAEALDQLVIVPLGQNDYEGAAALAEETMDIYGEIQERLLVYGPLSALMYAMLGMGNVGRAAEVAHEALQLARGTGYPMQMACGVLGYGYVAAARGRLRRSTILLAAGERLLNAVGLSELNYPVWRAFYELHLAKAKAELGESQFNEAAAEGQAMSLDQAVQFALEDAADG
jgi:hypothetical protein